MRMEIVAALLLTTAPAAAEEIFEPRAQLGAGAVEASVRTQDLGLLMAGVSDRAA